MKDRLQASARRYLASAISRIGYSVLWALDRSIPKRDTALICTWPDYDDQGLAIETELLRLGMPFQWAVHNIDKLQPPWDGEYQRPIMARSSLKCLWAYLRTNLLFFTHGYYGFAPPPRTKTVVNLWHGMPIKAIGALHDNKVVRFSFTLATSNYFQHLLQNAFRTEKENVQICGLPRNDRLLLTRSLPDDRLPHERFILWMPTYRRSSRGEARTDGSASSSIGGLTEFSSHDFEAALQQLNLTCIIKPHPMADLTDYPLESERVKIWTDDDIAESGLTLYQLLGRASLLISDASSVWVDYLLLNRPILFAFGDHAEYSATRGLASPGDLSIFPGPLITNQNQLIAELQKFCAQVDDHVDERTSLTKEFHLYQDANSAGRTVSAAIRRLGSND